MTKRLCVKCGSGITRVSVRTIRYCDACIKPSRAAARDARLAKMEAGGGRHGTASGKWHVRHRHGPGEHRLVVERALGHKLRRTAPVHHLDENKLNNAPSNLVACHDAAYHNLLHRRQRALEACGHADWLLCRECKQYDDPANLHVYNARKNKVHVTAFHLACAAAAMRAKYVPKARRA